MRSSELVLEANHVRIERDPLLAVLDKWVAMVINSQNPALTKEIAAGSLEACKAAARFLGAAAIMVIEP